MPPLDPEHARWFVDELLPHERKLRAWLGARFLQLNDIDDLIQESYTRLMRAHGSGPIANPKSFLFVTARNLALNHLRHLCHERPPDSVENDCLTDTLELRQRNLLRKPIIILNQDGYYDSLLAFYSRTVEEKFSRDDLRQKFQVARDLKEVFALLEQTKLPVRAISTR